MARLSPFRQYDSHVYPPDAGAAAFTSADQFCITAFVATTISGLMLTLPAFSQTPTIAMAASVLLLVPGFPLINSVADMFKGHINTGLARWAIASLLTLATCVGVVMSMTVWGYEDGYNRLFTGAYAGHDLVCDPRRRVCDGL